MTITHYDPRHDGDQSGLQAGGIADNASKVQPTIREKKRPEALWTLARGYIATSMIVIFQLMADSQHRDRFAVFDFEQCDIAAASKRNDQLLKEGRIGSCFATRKRRTPKRREAMRIA